MAEILIRPSPNMPPWQPGRLAFGESDRRLIAGTFRRLADLVHTLPPDQATDCLLLLTTCRNQWYAANALYVEAKKWCYEGRDTPGFGDALAALATAVSGTTEAANASRKAARLLATAAAYLQEFEKKQDLFLNRFEEVRLHLVAYGESIRDVPARLEFLTTFANVGTGSGQPEDALAGPDRPDSDVYLERLREWFAFARPVTGLARTFISEVLGVGRPHPDGKTCRQYLAEIQSASHLWDSRGFRCPSLPPDSTFVRVPALSVADRTTRSQLESFLNFGRDSAAVARQFLAELLPAVETGRPTRFPLKRPLRKASVVIHGKPFAIKSDLFVCITDMRNSTGDRHLAPELKIRIEDTIERLRQTGNVASQTVYDDARVIACDSFESLARCIRRITHVVAPFKNQEGFGGLRIGCTVGEMLFDYHESSDWKDIRRAPPLDSSDNTIATAARLMNLDKLRWEDSAQGRMLLEALRVLRESDSLVFLDSRVHEQLPRLARQMCQDVSVFDLRGIGRRQCWAVAIEAFAEPPADTPA